jgi:hypothetical protein
MSRRTAVKTPLERFKEGGIGGRFGRLFFRLGNGDLVRRFTLKRRSSGSKGSGLGVSLI